MKLLALAFTLYSLTSFALAGTIPSGKREVVAVDASRINYADNSNALRTALNAKGQIPENGKHYAIYEKWSIEGKPACYEHWTHWALVVGEYQRSQFRASSYGMFKDDGMGLTKSLVGAPTEAVTQENWWANHHWDLDERHWVTNSAKHQYDFAGEVVPGAMSSFASVTRLCKSLTTNFEACIGVRRVDTNEGIGENYVQEKEHRKYNVATNNCHNLAQDIFKKIKK